MNRLGIAFVLGALLLGTVASATPAAAAAPRPMDTSARAAAMVSPTAELLAAKNVDSVRRATGPLSTRGGQYCVTISEGIDYSSSVVVVTVNYGTGSSPMVDLQPTVEECGGETNTVMVEIWQSYYDRRKDASFTLAVL